jgi:hypothetical protein
VDTPRAPLAPKKLRQVCRCQCTKDYWLLEHPNFPRPGLDSNIFGPAWTHAILNETLILGTRNVLRQMQEDHNWESGSNNCKLRHDANTAQHYMRPTSQINRSDWSELRAPFQSIQRSAWSMTEEAELHRPGLWMGVPHAVVQAAATASSCGEAW